MRFCLPLNFACGVFAAVFGLLCLGTTQAEIVPFTMIDAALFPGAPPASIVVTTGQQIPGGVNNTAAGNEFNISYLFFDIDGDADVDGKDFLVWQAGFGASGTGTHATGDANLDTNVNAIDFNIWKNQVGEPLSPAAAVPEPANACLVAWCAVLLSVQRRRR